MISEQVDVVVVGAGVIGLATAHEVSRRGRSVLCLEQGAIGQGQSAGYTRIFRHVHESDRMARRAIQAREAWRNLESQLSEKFVGSEGVVVYGAEVAASEDWKRLGIEVRKLRPTEMNALLPLGGRRGESTREALLDVDGGTIRADRVCAGLAMALRGKIKMGRVFGLQVHDAGVEIQTSNGVWSCAAAIVAAGSHTAGLASAHGVDIPERRGLHLQISFEIKPGIEPPCFLDQSNQFGMRAYGSPVPGKREMAVGMDHRGGLLKVLKDDVLPPSTALREAESQIHAYVKDALPEVLGSPISSRLCVFTPLGDDPDSFSAWQEGPITFAAGHNAFKFAPLIASELADVAEGKAMPASLRSTR